MKTKSKGAGYKVFRPIGARAIETSARAMDEKGVE